MNNPIMFLKNFLANGNPNDLINNIKKVALDNEPQLKDVIDMVEKGNVKGVEEYARNFCNERGIPFDKAFSEFMNNFR